MLHYPIVRPIILIARDQIAIGAIIITRPISIFRDLDQQRRFYSESKVVVDLGGAWPCAPTAVLA